MTNLTRRDLLARSAGIIILAGDAAHAGVISGNLPWQPDAATPPQKVLNPTAWDFFTPLEAAAVEAIADRIIPPDPDTPGGRGAGCAVFIDRQLAGPYGSSEDLYNSPPFAHGAPNQGAQSATTPGRMYREGLAALEEYARSQGASSFTGLSPEKHDEILRGMENGTLQLRGTDGKGLFETLLKDVQSGFFADPIYGGNRDMCAWKMIGFPGARYDYRDWVGRHNERVPFAPVSIGGRAEWTPKKRG